MTEPSKHDVRGTLKDTQNHTKNSQGEPRSVNCGDIAKKASFVKLHITVKDKDGKTLNELDHNEDMWLDQWGMIMAALFKNLGVGTYAGATTFTCKDTSGTSRNLGGASGNSSPFFENVLMGLANQVLVQVGTGTSAAAHTDYGLQAAVSGATSYPTSISESNPSGNILYVSFSVTITIASATTVSEAVITVVVLDSTGAQRTLAITHDVFTGVPVPGGGSITLNYTLQFNTS